MKKEYCKPDIMFESFSLSTDIAAGCTAIIDTHRGGECGVNMEGLVVFTDKVNGCDFKIPDNGNNGICYHVPTGENNLFNS